jgi:N-acetylneuraminic acid mutarotase
MTPLQNGKVLVVGGSGNGSDGSFTAELYDPATGRWTLTGSLNDARDWHTATLLSDGKVLVTGGRSADYTVDLASVELYDPATGSWTRTNSLTGRRFWHTATLLPNGKVLVAGGYKTGNPSATYSDAQLYDPASGTWSATGSMSGPRYLHTATLLTNGQVLVAGGDMVSGTSAELYVPSTGMWTNTGSITVGRGMHTATLLTNGLVLVTGGQYASPTVELYDPASGTWSTNGPMSVPRWWHTATLLANGHVLVVGGSTYTANSLASTEVFDPNTGYWTAASSLNIPRSDHTASFLANGRALVAGGQGAGASVELLLPATVSSLPIVLNSPVKVPNGSFQFTFTNTPGAPFTALAATNAVLPLSNWIALGAVTEFMPGQFVFSDPQTTNRPQGFYRVRSP